MKNTRYSKEQVELAERIAKMLASVPKQEQEVTALILNAYVDGFIAGRNVEETGHEVLAN